jgi:hypothetical protein
MRLYSLHSPASGTGETRSLFLVVKWNVIFCIKSDINFGRVIQNISWFLRCNDEKIHNSLLGVVCGCKMSPEVSWDILKGLWSSRFDLMPICSVSFTFKIFWMGLNRYFFEWVLDILLNEAVVACVKTLTEFASYSSSHLKCDQFPCAKVEELFSNITRSENYPLVYLNWKTPRLRVYPLVLTKCLGKS